MYNDNDNILTMMLIPCSMVFSHWLRCVSVTSNSSLKDKNSTFPTFARLHGLSVVAGGAGADRVGVISDVSSKTNQVVEK